MVRAGIDLASQFGIKTFQRGRAPLEAVKRKAIGHLLECHRLAIQFFGHGLRAFNKVAVVV
jgi:hypothetical protein